jgi:hypothetical protein
MHVVRFQRPDQRRRYNLTSIIYSYIILNISELFGPSLKEAYLLKTKRSFFLGTLEFDSPGSLNI